MRSLSSVQRRLQRTAQILREQGLRTLWLKFLGESVYRRAILIERSVDAPVVGVPSTLPVTMRLLTDADVDAYVRWRPDTDPAEIRRRLRLGHYCMATWYREQLASVVWLAAGSAWIDYLARPMTLAADEVYVYEWFIAPAHRGQNLSTSTTAAEVQLLRTLGYRRMVAVIVPENTAAVRQVVKVGWRPIGTMGYVQLGPWRRDFHRVDVGAAGRPPRRARGAYGSAYWDHIAQDLEGRGYYLDAFLGDLKRRAYLTLIRSWGGVPAQGRVLKTDLFEEAMGPDAFLTALGGGTDVVVGMDVSRTMAQRAARRNGSHRALYVVADARRLPFKRGAFALVVSPSTLDHFADPTDLGRSLRELRDLLGTEGQLIVTLDNRQNVFDPLLRLAARMGRVPFYIGRSYTVDELRGELERAGLVVQETTAIVHNPRLLAVAAVTLAQQLGWTPFTRLVHRTLIAAQGLERSRWRYYTGCFVAAKATRRPSPTVEPLGWPAD